MRPGRNALVVFFLILGVGLGAVVWPSWVMLWGVAGLVLAAALIRDARGLESQPRVEVRREVPKLLPVGVWTTVKLSLVNRSSQSLVLLITDHPPAGAEFRSLPQTVEIPAQEGLTLSYGVRPRHRGDVLFGQVEIWTRSRLWFWERRSFGGEASEVRVLPNFRPVTQYTVLAVEDRLGSMGIRVSRRRGEGLEFEQLRDYRAGDSERQIDWKATQRRQKLISREYQEEKDQRLVMLVDCGRRMRSLDGETSHFDQALNAALLLTYAATRKGDSVGLATFAGPERWVPPLKGRNAMSAIMQAVYDLPVTQEPPDYLEAATRLATRLRRRSLVVILSNLRDEDTDELLPAVRMLRRRHLVLVASLREKVLRRALEKPPETLGESLLVSSIFLYEEARRKAHERVAKSGVMTLDTEPDQLPVALVNRYLEIKRSGVL